MLDTRRLFYFCTIVEQGQVTRAAMKLHISQPTLSLALRELEDELGMTLIHRAAGQWEVSEKGLALYREAQNLLAQLEDLGQRIRGPFAGKSGIFGEVRIGCSGFCLSFLSDMLADMTREYPGIHTRLLVTDHIALESKLQQQNVDFIITQLPLMYGNCTAIALKEQHLVAVWSPLLPVPAPGTISLEELSALPLMVARRWSNNGALRPFIIAMQEKGLTPRIILDTPFSSFLLDSLSRVPAVAVMHDTEISPSHTALFPVRRINLPKLVFRPALVWKKEHPLPEQARAVLSLICLHAGVCMPEE